MTTSPYLEAATAPPPLVPAFKALATIGIGRTRAYDLLNSGRIPAVKLGAKTMIRAEDLAAFIADLPPYKAASAAGSAA